MLEESMIELSRTQDEEVGDGTTSVIVLAGEMLHVAEAFIDKNYHPTVICRAYNKALEDAVSVLDKIALTVDVKDHSTMLRLVKSCIGTKFTSQFGDLIAACQWIGNYILRNYIVSKSTEHNFLTVACGEEVDCPDKIRRLVINTTFNDRKECCSFQYLRSLFWLDSVDSESGLVFQKVLDGRCRLLKVLDIRGAPIDGIPSEVFKLYCLKYLSLRRTNIKLIPKLIGNLRNLETLDLKQSKVTELPVEILKLHKLRHLIVYSFGDQYSFHSNTQTLKAPCEIGRYLTSLQKLCWIDADEADGIKIVREIGKLTQLKRLGISKLRREDGMDLCSSLEKLTELRTLYIYSIEEDEALDLDHSLSSPLPLLRKVILNGRLEKFPQWVCSLDGLTELHLRWNRLREDPLQHLGDLRMPNHG